MLTNSLSKTFQNKPSIQV